MVAQLFAPHRARGRKPPGVAFPFVDDPLELVADEIGKAHDTFLSYDSLECPFIVRLTRLSGKRKDDNCAARLRGTDAA